MSEPVMSPELEQATIAKLEAETQVATIKAEREAIDLERAQTFWRETKAEAEHNRIFSFWASVSDVTAKVAVDQLGEWSRSHPGEDISLVFNSPGGEVFSGLALFDYIQELKRAGHRVETVSLGMAASMGGILLQAGTHRVMGANAYMLIHEVSSTGRGKTSELEDEVKLVKRLQEKLLYILAERSTLNVPEIKKRWTRKDWWLDAQEALELGFIDEIR